MPKNGQISNSRLTN